MKSAFIHLILAFVICAAALVSYGILYRAVATASVAVTALQSQIDAKTKVVSRMAATRAAFADIAGDEAAVQQYFISETGVVAFIDDLEALGRVNGAATTKVLSVSADDASAQPTFTFALSIMGTFGAVMRTVGAIEYAPYAISISSLSVGQNAKNDWHADLTFIVGSNATSAPPKTS